MASPLDSVNRVRNALSKTLRAVGQTYGVANQFTHHALGWLLAALLVSYFAFGVIFLSLRYVLLPDIDRYKPKVEQIASHFLGRQVLIGTIHASWRGLRPNLALENVIIHNQAGVQALALPEVSATFSWWSVAAGEPRLYALEIVRPDLEIERDAEGRIFVAGILVDTDKADDGRSISWLLSQRQIVVRNGWVRWQDRLRNAPELVLENVDFLLQNQWRRHRVALKATPPQSLAAPIDVRAEFTRPAFAEKSADYTQWAGEIYMDWRNTNLAAWKPYFDYPLAIDAGTGSIRGWLNFDRGSIADFTADLALSRLTVQFAEELRPLNLVGASGRISAGAPASDFKGALLSFGRQGHALTLRDFSLRTDQGEVLPSTTVSHIFKPASRNQLEQHELKITALDLGALANLARHLPLSADLRDMLTSFAPRGRLHDFSASWEGSQPGRGKYQLAGKFTELSLNAQAARGAESAMLIKPVTQALPALPGFTSLSGVVDANQDGGTVSVNGKNLRLHLADYFPDPELDFEALDVQASWSLRQRQRLSIRLASMSFSQDGIEGSLEGSHVLSLLPSDRQAGKPGTIDLALRFPSLDLKRVVRFLPSLTPVATRTWMQGALIDGSASDVSVIIKGDLDKFPFPATNDSDNPANIFRISGSIQNGVLSPAPDQLAQDNRTALWPRIEDIRGSFLIDRTRLHIHADSARTRGVALSAVDAVIPDYQAASSVLEVNGVANGSLQSMLAYVNASPVLAWTDEISRDARTTGNARLNLKLQLPLDDGAAATVQGTVRLMGNELQIWRTVPPLQQANGEFGFTEKGFQLEGVQGNFLGGPITLKGGTQRDGSTLVKLDGTLSAEGLARSFPASATRSLMKKMSGSTRYSAMLRVRKGRPELTIDSSLAGLGIDLPPPLRKSAAEALPLSVSMIPALSDEATQAEEIRITLGNGLSALYLRQKPRAALNAPWKLVRGGIGVNQPVPQPASGLGINLNMPSLNIDAWRGIVSNFVAEQEKQDAAGASTGANAVDFSTYVLPDQVAIRAAELIVVDKRLHNVVLGASRQSDNWQVNIHSRQAVGYATWNDPSSERGAGKLTARLASLILPESAVTDVTDLLGSQVASKPLPGLDIVADNFELMDINLGRLELTASNAGFDFGREWRINRLAINNPDASLSASGRWSTSIGQNQSSLSYALDIANAGKLLNRLGFAGLLKGGKGKMTGDINWRGPPYAFDIPSLSGTINLNVSAGQFLKVEPGAAKLLGVMSLQSLPRRLVLDFRDLFSEGFAFDGIASAATITRGIIKTDSFKMRGVNAVVLMDGTVDLAAETQNLDVVIVPEVNLGGASVVYGLAVNPVVGLGSFLAQLFLRSPLSQVLTQEYQISGPWKDPIVKKVLSKRKFAGEPGEPASSGDSK